MRQLVAHLCLGAILIRNEAHTAKQLIMQLKLLDTSGYIRVIYRPRPGAGECVREEGTCKRGCFGTAVPVAICKRRAGCVVEWHGAWPSRAKRFGRSSFSVMVCGCGEGGVLPVFFYRLESNVSQWQQAVSAPRPSFTAMVFGCGEEAF